MAHLNADSRAQLLLVGGVVVAFTIVGVALVLNALVLTDSLETSEPPRGIDHAGEYEAVVADGVDGLLRAEERTPYGSWADAEDGARAGVGHVDGLALNRTLQGQDAYASTTVSSARRGATLAQNDSSRVFTDEDDDSDWELADDTEGVRNFRMVVDPSQTGPPGSDSFTVWVNGSSSQWNASVYTTGSDTVEIETSMGTTCSASGSNVTINWTDGTLGGCTFEFARDASGDVDSPYDVEFHNGDQAAGTYHLVVSDVDGDNVDEGNFEDPGDGNPYYHPAVYSLVLDVEYDGPAVEYDSDPRVAPGEPPETRP